MIGTMKAILLVIALVVTLIFASPFLALCRYVDEGIYDVFLEEIGEALKDAVKYYHDA